MAENRDGGGAPCWRGLSKLMGFMLGELAVRSTSAENFLSPLTESEMIENKYNKET